MGNAIIQALEQIRLVFHSLRIEDKEANGYHKKYVDGYVDGTFRPDRSVTRAEIAAMLVKIGAVEEAPEKLSSFTDVPLPIQQRSNG
ncbi:S-layer homology domain-containing protein [Paenibacillaceae bacterium]|nr:S-layer homology domain-containing protein [Paenibacillaceae bacterium]